MDRGIAKQAAESSRWHCERFSNFARARELSFKHHRENDGDHP
jgi:hypothetical protein